MAKMKTASQAVQVRELVRRNGEAVNDHDLAAMAEAFPDYCIVMDELIVEANKVAYLVRLEGTHLGPYQTADGRTVPRTGKRVALQMVNVRQRSGKIVKLVNSWDRLSLLAHLGLLPNPPAVG